MKIIVVCSSDYMAIPAALVLQQQGILAAIVIPEKYNRQLRTSFLQSGIDDSIIHTVTRQGLEHELISLTDHYNAGAVFVITFPWKFPKTVLERPEHGCINFHPGLLPAYKGADPIFWQLKNREKEGGFSVHVMTERIDEGPLLLVKKMSLIPGETYGMHHKRLGMLAADIVPEVLQQITDAAVPAHQEKADALYFKRPDKKQVTIDWKRQSSEDIEALVNATNPKYNGAFTSIRNMEMSILDIGFAEINNAGTCNEPGTIIYADALYGLLVACADGKFLRINTVCMPEGYFSGSKLFGLGFRAGEKFL